jgi:lysozyme
MNRGPIGLDIRWLGKGHSEARLARLFSVAEPVRGVSQEKGPAVPPGKTRFNPTTLSARSTPASRSDAPPRSSRWTAPATRDNGSNSTAPRRLNRRARAREFFEHLQDRRRIRRQLRQQRIRAGLRAKRKRKMALAASASVMTLSTAAIDTDSAARQSASIQKVNPSETRVTPAMLEASDDLKQAMIEEEGVRYTVYRDVAGYPTVGVGHLLLASDGLQVGDHISEERALKFFEQDIALAEDIVRRVVGDMKLYQHEFDALVDLAFNVGEGTLSPDRSPGLTAAIETRDYERLADELEYHHAAGAIANGLVYRSERRTNIFLDAQYDDPRELRA